MPMLSMEPGSDHLFSHSCLGLTVPTWTKYPHSHRFVSSRLSLPFVLLLFCFLHSTTLFLSLWVILFLSYLFFFSSSSRQFILRRQVISLYRDFNRAIKLIEDAKERGELRDWIRDDFKQHVHLQDEQIIKMHLVRGRKALKQLQVTLTLPQVHPSDDDTNKRTNVWWALSVEARKLLCFLSFFRGEHFHLFVNCIEKEARAMSSLVYLSVNESGKQNRKSDVASTDAL